MSSPTQRTLEYCRKQGWLAGVVERRTPGAPGRPGRAHDLFGFADLVAIRRAGEGPRVLLIQTTDGTSVAARCAKLSRVTSCTTHGPGACAKRDATCEVLEGALPEVLRCLEAGCAVEVWGWARSERLAKDPKARAAKRKVVRYKLRRLRAEIVMGCGCLADLAAYCKHGAPVNDRDAVAFFPLP